MTSEFCLFLFGLALGFVSGVGVVLSAVYAVWRPPKGGVPSEVWLPH